MKDSFLRVYRAEYSARLAVLNQTTLHADAVIARVEAMVAEWDLAEINGAPAGQACNFEGEAENFRRFARARYDAVTERAELPE